MKLHRDWRAMMKDTAHEPVYKTGPTQIPVQVRVHPETWVAIAEDWPDNLTTLAVNGWPVHSDPRVPIGKAVFVSARSHTSVQLERPLDIGISTERVVEYRHTITIGEEG